MYRCPASRPQTHRPTAQRCQLGLGTVPLSVLALAKAAVAGAAAQGGAVLLAGMPEVLLVRRWGVVELESAAGVARRPWDWAAWEVAALHTAAGRELLAARVARWRHSSCRCRRRRRCPCSSAPASHLLRQPLSLTAQALSLLSPQLFASAG